MTPFKNKECLNYPCHTDHPEMVCNFCYCPLYQYQCPGVYTILDNGIKDCSSCMLPHTEEGLNFIVSLLVKQFHSYQEHCPPDLIPLY